MKTQAKKFWTWKNLAEEGQPAERVLELYGTIAEESWFDDDITPRMFKEELVSGDGDITVWINSPGGDCVAASQIYTMLMDYKGNVTVKIDGIAASAASVIAMAGTKVLMAPTALMMIHNPMTGAFGDCEEMQKAIEMLNEVKETYEKTLVQTLADQMVFRKLANAFTTASNNHKIPVVATHGTANWVEESGEIPETTETFAQKHLGAHKLSALIKVSEELLNDAAFDLEGYFQKEFIRRMANAEEIAFITGDGNGKPTGLFHDEEGAEVGVTAASATAITADEIIKLYHSLRAPYRQNAVWLLNDSTIEAIRLLKDQNGQYIWHSGLKDGAPDTLLGRPVYTSTAVPGIGAGQKVIAFGDLSYYWIGDREGINFRRLNELYAQKGQVGFLATKRVDAKLILPEAVKVLQMKEA